MGGLAGVKNAVGGQHQRYDGRPKQRSAVGCLGVAVGEGLSAPP
jgi:hypothetical protein